MFDWILDNWLVLTLCSCGLYAFVFIIEKIVKRKKSKTDMQVDATEGNNTDEKEFDTQS